MIVITCSEKLQVGDPIWIMTDGNANDLRPRQPAVVLREATYEEYAAFVEADGFTVPPKSMVPPRRSFYEVTTD